MEICPGYADGQCLLVLDELACILSRMRRNTQFDCIAAGGFVKSLLLSSGTGRYSRRFRCIYVFSEHLAAAGQARLGDALSKLVGAHDCDFIGSQLFAAQCAADRLWYCHVNLWKTFT